MTILDRVADRLGYQKRLAVPTPPLLTKAGTDFEKNREGFAQSPLQMAYASMNNQWGLRRPSQITLNTLRRMSRANWVDRTCIFTLRDEITSIPWDIAPIDPKKPFNEGFQRFLIRLLNRPNPNRENWRTLIDKIMEDILVVDAGCLEKVRDGKHRVVELYHVDGACIKPVFDEHGMAGDPAYEQYLPNQKQKDPVATFSNDDLVYMMWNPQGAIDAFGYGMSPVEAGLAVGTAFLYAEAYNLGFFRSNSIPPVIINMGKEVPAGQVNQFSTFLASEMMGPDGNFKPVVGSFGDGFDIKELMKNPTEMGFKEYVTWQMRWKVALYRMSPQDIGFTLDQYKVEGDTQLQLSKNKAIDSLKGVVKDYLNTEIVNDPGYEDLGQNLQFQWIDTETVDPLVQAQIDDIYIKNGKSAINEVRRRDGQDPVQGGQKPLIILGAQVIPLSNEVLDQLSEQTKPQDPTDEKDDPKGDPNDGDDSKPDDEATETEKTADRVKKNFTPSEGTIVALSDNQTAVAWMDDRGVTQPFFVADYGKSQGFAIKPSFLDDRKEQEPPEAKVADILRLLKVNTPEVQILPYDDVLKLLPTHLYEDFTRWINVQTPYDSKEWRDRWGDTRKSAYYIVSGLLTGKDLGNEELQKAMNASPESYFPAVRDLSRIWLAERRFYLGDRKPGHYLITDEGNGFGVDYQFFQDEPSWERTHHFLPDTLALIHPKLAAAFEEFVRDEAEDFGIAKAFRPSPIPDDWVRSTTVTDIERKLAQKLQRSLTAWYRQSVRILSSTRPLVQKTADFDPKQEYLIGSDAVYQNGVKYPLSVIGSKAPSSSDVTLSPVDYRPAFDFGVVKAELSIKTRFPDIKVQNPDLYAPMFEDRANLVAGNVSNTLKKVIDATIVRGINEGATYGEIADEIQQAMGVDPEDAEFPLWRAERIARTESMWAINEGMRQQFKEVGIQKVDVEVASTACDACVSLAQGNPYDVSEAGDLLPAHSNCRCVLTGDFSDLLG